MGKFYVPTGQIFQDENTYQIMITDKDAKVFEDKGQKFINIPKKQQGERK